MGELVSRKSKQVARPTERCRPASTQPLIHLKNWAKSGLRAALLLGAMAGAVVATSCNQIPRCPGGERDILACRIDSDASCVSHIIPKLILYSNNTINSASRLNQSELLGRCINNNCMVSICDRAGHCEDIAIGVSPVFFGREESLVFYMDIGGERWVFSLGVDVPVFRLIGRLYRPWMSFPVVKINDESFMFAGEQGDVSVYDFRLGRIARHIAAPCTPVSFHASSNTFLCSDSINDYLYIYDMGGSRRGMSRMHGLLITGLGFQEGQDTEYLPAYYETFSSGDCYLLRHSWSSGTWCVLGDLPCRGALEN